MLDLVIEQDQRDFHSNLVSTSPYNKREEETDELQVQSEEVWNLFHQDAQELEDCIPYVRAFASTTSFGPVLFAELKCGSWECRTCGPKLKFKWYKKQLSHALESTHLEKIEISKSEWGAFRKRLNRAEASYMTYARDNDKMLVLHNGQLGGTKIDKSNRQSVLISAIKDTKFQRQPISQGRGWNKKPSIKTNEQESMPNWKPLDNARVSTLAEVQEIIAKEGYQGRNYDIEREITGSAKGMLVILKPADYWKVLWKLGVCMRRKGESRNRRYQQDSSPADII